LTKSSKRKTVARSFLDACLAELDALKPGNVHRFGDGHRMTLADFVTSAEAAAPSIGRKGLSVGKRIKLAIEATQRDVAQNTNLGIVLLAAPLANAALDQSGGDLQARLRRVLQDLSIDDARDAYRAIRAAAPGGLGDAREHDVQSEPAVTLLEAMRAAEARDRIAWNYTHDFDDIFRLGLRWLAHAQDRWSDPAWATARVYLGFLAHVPDTLIERKFGERVAAGVREEARPIESGLNETQSPEAMIGPLTAFDRALKDRNLNPGTSADLTVATLFAAAIEARERPQ
jgi:triphosphoribosyl-dephospho-CoA synthase